MTNAASRVACGLLALAALALLVIGVPAFLAHVVGWPLPHGTISMSAISDALDGTTPIPDTFWLGTLAGLAWIMWLRVTIAVLAETRAAIAGRPASDHGVRRAIAPLVAAVLLTVASTRTVRPAAAAPIRPLPAAAAPQAAPTPPLVAPADPEAAPTWTVARNDTLWEIAERTLGDPMRWRDIYDLNEGRPQPDGDTLRDPSLLRPGWTLQLPANASPERQPAASVTVEPGDTLSGIAQRTLGDSERYPDLFAANEGVTQADGFALEVPNLIRPGWQLTIPQSTAPDVPAAAGAPSSTNPPEAAGIPADPSPPAIVASPSTSSPPTTGSPSSANGSADHPSEDHQNESALIVAGLLAGGIISAIGTARTRARRRRRTGDAVPAPAEVSVALEAQARRGAALRPPQPVTSLLSTFAAELPGDVQIDALSIAANGELEVLLHQHVPGPPPGWTADATGRLLTSQCSGEPSDAVPSSRWLLCTLGTSGDREVLIDLARPALTLIDGAAGEDVALFRTLLLAMATSPLGVCADVIYVGRPRAPELETIRVFTGDDVVGRLAQIAHANRDLTAAEAASASRAIVFLDARFVDDETTNEIAALAHPGLPVVIVGDSGRTAERLLTVEDGSVSVTPAGLTVTAATTPDEVSQLWVLSESGAVDVELPPPRTDVMLDECPAGVRSDEEALEVVVRVLGAVRVEGVADSFSRRIAEEVVAYLVLHRRGVDEGRLKTALWPERTPATSSFNQAVSRARVALGTNRSGEHHLPHITADGLYRVDGSVTSDVEILDTRLKAANLDPNEDTMAALGNCIAAVEGLPFAGTGAGYEWAYAEGLVGWAQALVSDAAHVLASWAITNGDAALALRATRSALMACPADEILYRDQMLAHDLAGNPAGVAAAMRELLAVIEAEVPQDAVHPETLALYERLCPRARDASIAPVR